MLLALGYTETAITKTCLYYFVEAVLTSTHNLCFEQKYEKYSIFLSEFFYFLMVRFSVYLNRHVFVMVGREWRAVASHVI